MALLNGPRIVTSGLVLNLDAADRNSYVSGSTIWNDLSGNGNNGTLTNGPTFSSANGGSIVFDGVDDYADINNTVGNGSNVSLEAWFRTTQTTPWRHLLVKGSSGQFQYALRFGFSTASDINVIAWQAGSSNYAAVSSTGIVANNGNWYHVVGIIVEGVGVFIYINGVLNNSSLITTGTYNKNGTSILKLASRDDDGTKFNGNIGNVKIYNRALSAQEVAQNYNATKTRYGL